MSSYSYIRAGLHYIHGDGVDGNIRLMEVTFFTYFLLIAQQIPGDEVVPSFVSILIVQVF